MRWAVVAWLAVEVGCTGSHHGERARRDASCLSTRGCPALRALPTCDGHESNISNVVDGDGEAITVRGMLAVGELTCTLVACPGHCCNTCGGSLAVVAGGEQIALRGGDLSAHGDESLACPNAGVPGQGVIVTGTLHRRANGRFEINDARVCALPRG